MSLRAFVLTLIVVACAGTVAPAAPNPPASSPAMSAKHTKKTKKKQSSTMTVAPPVFSGTNSMHIMTATPVPMKTR